MPSSLIIVALAAAWLVVLVPMVARKRQQVAQTADSALAARVVRSGCARNEGREEFSMSEDAEPSAQDDLADRETESAADYDDYEEIEPEPARSAPTRIEPDHRYRPGRGGFDPEAAEVAARAKYSYRQRVVVILLLLVVATVVAAGFVWTMLWWANGLVDAVLVGYLAYLRRQVRIENEIRQRRLARFNHSRTARTGRPSISEESVDDVHVVSAQRREVVERKPSPTSRMRRHAVVVDLDDEDPAFHELDEPGTRPFRRASGE